MLRRLRRLWPFVKLVLALTILVAVGRRFALDLRNHPDLWHHSFRPGWLVLSGVLYSLGQAFWGGFWYRLMHTLHQQAPFLTALRAYYIGQMGKYLPGKAWALLLRAGLVQGPGVSAGLAGATAFYEVITTMSAAALVGLVCFGLMGTPSEVPLDQETLRRLVLLEPLPQEGVSRSVGVVVAVVLLVPLLVPIVPPVFNRLVHHVSLPFRAKESVLPKLPGRALPEGLLITGVGWCCIGFSLWALLQGVLPDPPVWDGPLWGRLTGAMGLAYAAGFVVLVAPSGLGVREYLLTLFLVTELSPNQSEDAAARAAVALAVLMLRLVWSLAEVLMVGLVWWLPGPRHGLTRLEEPS